MNGTWIVQIHAIMLLSLADDKHYVKSKFLPREEARMVPKTYSIVEVFRFNTD